MLFFAILLLAIIIPLAIFKYPTLSLVLFLSVGFFKTILMMKSSFFIKYDPTVLCAIILSLSMFYFFIRRRMPFLKLINRPVIVFLLLVVVLFFGLTWSTAPKYAFLKSSRVATLGLISLLAPLVFCSKMKDIKNLLALLCLVGVILAVGTLIAPYSSVFRSGAEYRLRASFLEADPLEVAVKIGTAAIICFYLMIAIGTSVKVKAISFFVLIILLWAILLSGSRGPFWGLILTILVALFVARKKLSPVSVALFGLLGFFVIVHAVSTSTESGIQRVIGVLEEDNTLSSTFSSRSGIYGMVLGRLDEDVILGHGTGSFAFDFYGVDEKMYPHNILLELQYENGFLGLLVFCCFMLLVFRRWLSARRNAPFVERDDNAEALIYVVGLLILYNLLQAMKSSDLDGNRFLFMLCGLAVAAYNCTIYQTEYVELLEFE